jgi:predicted DNA-binding transcriptional regulator AlpA
MKPQVRSSRSEGAAPSTADIELLPMRALLRVLGLKSRQAVYHRLRNVPNFPKPRRVGSHSIAWLRSEVAAYVQSLPIAELDGFDAIERRRTST